MNQCITVLGATGSIGTSTLDVIGRHPDRFSVFALTGAGQWQLLAEQCRRHKPRFAVLANDTHYARPACGAGRYRHRGAVRH